MKFNIKILRAYFSFLAVMVHRVNHSDTTHVLESLSFITRNFVHLSPPARLFTMRLAKGDHSENCVLFITVLHE